MNPAEGLAAGLGEDKVIDLGEDKVIDLGEDKAAGRVASRSAGDGSTGRKEIQHA